MRVQLNGRFLQQAQVQVLLKSMLTLDRTDLNPLKINMTSYVARHLLSTTKLCQK